MEVWGATDQGKVRKMNQDYYRCQALGKGQFLAVVCDGMGGAKSGDVASRLASDVFREEVRQNAKPQMTQQEIVKLLVGAVESANQAVYEQAGVSSDFAGMGTTLVAAFMQDNQVFIVNVGDSRCYYVVEDDINQVTEDHSVVGMMVARGQITEEEARNHPNKNLITRAIGTEKTVSCDCFYLSLARGDYLLLCSDGLSNMVSNSELLYEIVHGGDESDCCNRLIDIAKTRGAPDNITVVLIKY